MKAAARATLDLLADMGVPDEVVAAYREAVRRFGRRNWVSGIGVGRKVKNGRLVRSPRWVVAIHVKHKRPRSKVARRNLVPSDIAGVPTDVILGRYRRQAKAPLVANPLRPGVAIATEKGSGGTLGGVLAGSNGTRFLFTAAHVLQDGGGKKGTAVVHPPSTAGAPGNVVGHVAALHKTRDAGLVALAAGVAASNVLPDGTTLRAPQVPQLDMPLQMLGAASGVLRKGRVLQVGQTSPNGTFPVIFVRLSTAAPIPGDSGAVWHEPTSGHAVGLHVESHDNAVATLATRAVADLSTVASTTLSWL